MIFRHDIPYTMSMIYVNLVGSCTIHYCMASYLMMEMSIDSLSQEVLTGNSLFDIQVSTSA